MHPQGLKFVKANGELAKLTPGFRFEPTEQELVFHYLQRKVFSLPLPASVILELPNIYNYDPWNLPGDKEQKDRYFFSNEEAAKYQTNKFMSSSGYWIASDSAEKHITCPNNSKIITSPTSMVIGVKKTMVFYLGNPPHQSKTDWIMHEYRLAGVSPATGSSASPPAPQTFSQPAMQKNDHSQGSSMQHIADLVVCHVFQKKKGNGKVAENAEADLITIRDRLSYDSDDDDNGGDSYNLATSSSKFVNE